MRVRYSRAKATHTHKDGCFVHPYAGRWKRSGSIPPDLSAGKAYGPRHLELLDGLESIILTEGFRELTIGGLAERLQCSRRTIYEIAESKERIVLVVVDRLLRRVARRAHDAAQMQDPGVERLRAFLIPGLVELRRCTLTFTCDVAEEQAVHDLVESHLQYAVRLVAVLLAEGMEAGEFGDIHPFLAAEVLDAGLARLLDPGVLRTAGLTLVEALEELLTLFIDGLRPARDRAGAGSLG
ncbi:MAG TPA: TetR/AcrR family transcriptional regulator [Acidimicrobiales bacterium]|nr:TetR/AcrR family transcriptional regulator [Acidimicrobiales bacterium]